MAPILIITLISLTAALRSAAYGLYTWQEENKCGSVGLFVIAFTCLAVSIFTFISILTNL